MKKIIIGLLLVVGTICVHAQITIDSSKAFKAEGYVGVLLAPKLGVDSAKVSVTATIRAGANVYWTPNPWFTLGGVGSIEVNEKGGVTPLYLISTRFLVHKNVAITLGKIGSPMTELRALPNSSGGQFETWTASQILPSAFGGKVTVTVNEQSKIVAGAFWRGKSTSVELGAKVPHVQMGVYYQVDSRMFGGAIKVSTKYLNSTVVYNHKRNLGINASLFVPKTAGCILYSDVGFSATNWKWIRGEWGVLKVFTIKKVQALVGMGYAHETKGVWGYLQISL